MDSEKRRQTEEEMKKAAEAQRVSKLDQAGALHRENAQMTAVFFHGLLESKVPPEHAREITKTYVYCYMGPKSR